MKRIRIGRIAVIAIFLFSIWGCKDDKVDSNVLTNWRN